MPLGISNLSSSLGNHRAPSGCLCGGSLDKTANYSKYLLEDACHGKQPNKFGGLASNDLFVFIDRSEMHIAATHFPFYYSFLYNFHISPSAEHVPKTIPS